MDVLKKLVVVGRTNNSDDSVSSGSSGDGDEMFCYHRHEESKNVIAVESPALEPYISSRRPPAVITSTEFDSDEAFAIVARAMLFRYDNENMSERETIDATLTNAEDKRAFLEAMDLKYAKMGDVSDETEASGLFEVLLRARSIFVPTLKNMWNEIESTEYQKNDTPNIFSRIIEEPDAIMGIEEEYYRRPPKTPKNLRLSPIQCAFTASYFNCEEQREDASLRSFYSGDFLSTPSKRRRQWFFSERNSDSKTSTSSSIVNPFAPNKSYPEFRFELGSKTSAVKSFAFNKSHPNFRLDFGATRSIVAPVQSLPLDGFETNLGGKPMYMPPTSPIRKVSMEFQSTLQGSI
jgi:hypothetical protein